MSLSDPADANTNAKDEWSLLKELFPERNSSTGSDFPESLSAHYKRIYSSATRALFDYLDQSHRCSAGTGAFSVKDETFRYSASSVEVHVRTSTYKIVSLLAISPFV